MSEKKRPKGKVEGGPLSPFGKYKTRQQQLDEMEREIDSNKRKRDNQSTDSAN